MKNHTFMHTSKLFAFLLLVLGAGQLAAQQSDEPARLVGFLNGNFQVGIPMEDFQDNLGKIGFGGGGLALIRFNKNLPFFGGLELSGMTYDSEAQTYQLNIGGFIERYTLRTNNSIFLMHGLVRVSPPVNLPVRFYLDGMVGVKNLYTRSKLTNDFNQEDTRGNVEQGDWAFSYGGAAGLMIPLGKEGGTDITLDIRCAYLPGATATYLVRKSNDNGPYDDPIDAFEEKASATTLLMPQVGITIKLWSDSFDEEFND